MLEVKTWHVGFDSTRLRVHGHHACTEERLVVNDRVARCHFRVELRASAVGLVFQQRHRHLGIEGGLNLCVARAVVLHHAVAFTLLDSAVNHVVGFRLGYANVREGGVTRLHAVECGLQIACHMVTFGLLTIFLHSAVDSRIDFQAVGVDVVVRAVLLRVLVAPSVQRVGLPSERVIIILLILPRCIVVPFRFVGHHPLAQQFAEIRRDTFLMVCHMETCHVERFGLRFFHLFTGDVTTFIHLRKHEVTAVFATFRKANGIEIRRVLAHAHQRGTFLQSQVNGVFRKIRFRRNLDADGIMQEVEVVEVHRQDFLLRIVAFKLYGNVPLDRFLHESVHDGGVHIHVRIKLLGQLLCDGRTTTGRLLSHEAAFDNCTEEGAHVNARVLKETGVLGCYKCVDEIRRK